MELKKNFKIVSATTLLSLGVLSSNANAFGAHDELIFMTNLSRYSDYWEEVRDPFTFGTAYFLVNNKNVNGLKEWEDKTPIMNEVVDYFKNNKYMLNSDAKINPKTQTINIFPKGQKVYTDQCVSLVNATGWESYGHTSTWKKLYKLDKEVVKDLMKGVQIATFSPNGKYGNPKTDNPNTGHTAIFLKATKDGILVVDQNFFVDKKNNIEHYGQVAIHEIKFNGKGTVGDAGSYWVFDKP